MFIDRAVIECQAGNGGDGAISWRREKFVPAGGPDGGDGGSGASIYLEADPDVRTLLDFKYKSIFKAPSGENGKGKKQFGKSAEDLILKVPVGTLVREFHTKLAIADLRKAGQRFLLVKGGLGGKGNVHFKSSTRQAPRFAKPGGMGQKLKVQLELKLLADVGLVGLPNVGKSTLLSVLTKAKPKIANYPFTTLSPNLGVVEVGPGASFVLADIPGLIAGASQGAGLGHDFLRHIERTRVLAHVLDMSGSEGRDVLEDYDRIQEELGDYQETLPDRVRVIVANKMDLPGAEANLESFLQRMKERGTVLRRLDPNTKGPLAKEDPWGLGGANLWEKGEEKTSGGKRKEAFQGLYLVETSAATTAGGRLLSALLQQILSGIEKTDLSFDEELVAVDRFFQKDPSIQVRREGKRIRIEGEAVENLAKKLIISDSASVQFFERSLEQMGVMDQVRALDPEEEDVIDIVGFEFDWL